MSEHKHGSMDIKDQEKTFAGFVKFSTNTNNLYRFVGVNSPTNG